MGKLCECGCGEELKPDRRGHLGRFILHHQSRFFPRLAAARKKKAELMRKRWNGRRLKRGTTRKKANGYIDVKTGRNEHSWRKQHILVMEAAIGRRLKKGECVHHINGICHDNRIDNLFLCSSFSEHSQIEQSASRLLKSLVAFGFVRFNREARGYELLPGILIDEFKT
jgi:hypothetical protein